MSDGRSGLDYSYVAFFDLRDAIKTVESLSSHNPPLYAHFVPETKFCTVTLNGNTRADVLKDLAVVLITLPRSCTRDQAFNFVSSFGQLRSLNCIPELGQRKYSAEFFDIRAAHSFLEATHPPHVVVKSLAAEHEVYSNPLKQENRISVGQFASPEIHSQLQVDNLNEHVPTQTYAPVPLPCAVIHPRLDPVQPVSLPQKLGVITRADVPKNNVIDLDRIARGLDTRTTVMLRNIPNKVDQKMLKQYVDVTNENTYDFLCKSLLDNHLPVTLTQISGLISQTSASK
uniref:ARAD1C41360p n=1 Tax=Blastobotrys adeninivorans TaxID=409370 RepID=A0A060T968_BLAAD